MDQLIPIINRLSQVLHCANREDTGRLDAVTFKLPTIVVVGAQSSGKSSVLEGLVGKDFLPRGKDIVTRRPLILNLMPLASNGVDDKHDSKHEYAIFGHKPDVYHDFGIVRREIEKETDRVAGRNKGINRQPIFLSVYSTNVIPLTLVDLPGITKIPVGEQPADIEQQVRQLILEYVSRPNALLLAITPANSDLVNSDALKIAREVDPMGLRTIGVLTKVDLMDAGTNALDILQNRGAFRLRHGFVGVVMRSQQDIMQNVPISESVSKETVYFKSNTVYRSLGNRWGISFLGKELNRILLQHIRQTLPDLKSRINQMVLSCQSELMSFGEANDAKMKKGSLLLKLVTSFVTDFQEAILGTCKSLHSCSNDELVGGAKLSFIFTNTFYSQIAEMDAAGDLSLEQGPRPAIFIPEGSFEVLIKRQIARLEPPALHCVELVYDELHRLLSKTSRTELKRYPNLTQKMTDVSSALIRERLYPTNEMISNLIRIEQAYINTNHPDFLTSGPAFQAVAKAVEERRRREVYTRMSASLNSSEELPVLPIGPAPATPTSLNNRNQNGGLLSYLFKTQQPILPEKTTPEKKKRPNQDPPKTTDTLSEREEFETQLIMTLLHGYFSIVKRNILDTVPKATMYFLVNHVMEQLPTRLVSELYKEELFGELMKEDDNVVKQRQRCRDDLEALERAVDILNNLRDVSI